MKPWWDRLGDVVGGSDASLLREIRAAAFDEFHERLAALVLMRTRAAGGLFLVALLSDYASDDDVPRLEAIYRRFAVPIYGALALSNRIPDTAVRQTGIPVTGLDKMNVTEFRLWVRDEPDSHELVDGQPIPQDDIRQASRRTFRILTALANVDGRDPADHFKWLEADQPGLGIPWDLTAKGWSGTATVLRHLAEKHPGCNVFDPDTATIQIGFEKFDMLADAERRAAIQASRDRAGQRPRE